MPLTLADLAGKQRKGLIEDVRSAAHLALQDRYAGGLSPFAISVRGEILPPRPTATYARALAAAMRGGDLDGNTCEPAISMDLSNVVAARSANFLVENASETARVIVAHLLNDAPSAVRLLSRVSGIPEKTLEPRLGVALPLLRAAFGMGGDKVVGWAASGIAAFSSGRAGVLEAQARAIVEATSRILVAHLTAPMLKAELAGALRTGIGGATLGVVGVSLAAAVKTTLFGPFGALAVAPMVYTLTSRASERTLYLMADAVARAAAQEKAAFPVTQGLLQAVLEEIDIDDAVLAADILLG